jgi:hypothetical protein
LLEQVSSLFTAQRGVAFKMTVTQALSMRTYKMNKQFEPTKRYRKLAERYHEAIHHVLLHEWDLFGVAAEPAAADEYNGYIPKLHGMLIRHEPRSRLVDHLWWVETECMGLCGDRLRNEAGADRLLGLRDEIEANLLCRKPMNLA